MVNPPPQLLASVEAAPDDLSRWDVLEDWALENAPGLARAPASLPAPEGYTFRAHWRCGLATHGFLQCSSQLAPSLYHLEPLLRAPALRLLTSLRVGIDWPRSNVVLFGLSPVQQPPTSVPSTIAPAVLSAVLASAPPELRRLGVWLPANPPWSDREDATTQLAPLLRQRPLTAEHLELRIPRRGALKLVTALATMRWRSITLASPLDGREVQQLAELGRAHRDVSFVLVRMPNAPPAPAPLTAIDDPDDALVTLSTGERHLLRVVGTSVPELDAAGVVLNRELGLWELSRSDVLPSRAVVEVNGAPLLRPLPLRSGEHLDVRVHVPAWPPPEKRSATFTPERNAHVSFTFETNGAR